MLGGGRATRWFSWGGAMRTDGCEWAARSDLGTQVAYECEKSPGNRRTLFGM